MSYDVHQNIYVRPDDYWNGNLQNKRVEAVLNVCAGLAGYTRDHGCFVHVVYPDSEDLIMEALSEIERPASVYEWSIWGGNNPNQDGVGNDNIQQVQEIAEKQELEPEKRDVGEQVNLILEEDGPKNIPTGELVTVPNPL